MCRKNIFKEHVPVERTHVERTHVRRQSPRENSETGISIDHILQNSMTHRSSSSLTPYLTRQVSHNEIFDMNVRRFGKKAYQGAN